MLPCPACGGRQVGKIGSDQYYCWNCFVEFDTYNRFTKWQKMDSWFLWIMMFKAEEV